VSWKTDSVDISMGGMFLSGEAPVAIGSEVTLTFELPTLGTVTLPCFVRWSSARGFGVQFGLLGARDTHAIGQLVRAEPQAVQANR
jgi:type IV pilus assembly protein PilZ